MKKKKSFLLPISLFFWAFTPGAMRHTSCSYFWRKLGHKNTSVCSQTINGKLDLQKVLQKGSELFCVPGFSILT